MTKLDVFLKHSVLQLNLRSTLLQHSLAFSNYFVWAVRQLHVAFFAILLHQLGTVLRKVRYSNENGH